jgi:hypothetical protein
VSPSPLRAAPAAPAGLQSPGSGRVGTNPLFNASPLASQPGGQAVAAAPAGGASEAEMLQQLMSEINRLKRELGE